MRAVDLVALRAELESARADLALLIASASQLSDSYRLTYGDDMATVSGTRRKHSDTATARKFGANTREAAAWAAVRHAGVDVERIERRITLAVRDTPIPYTPADLAAARQVRDRNGWHRVIKVNVKSITVLTEWSWTERIALADVIEVRA